VPLVLQGVDPILLWVKPDLGDRDFLSSNLFAVTVDTFDPCNTPLMEARDNGGRAVFSSYPHWSARLVGKDNGGPASFLYDRLIRQAGVERLDGKPLDLGQIREDRGVTETLWNGFNSLRTISSISYSYITSGVVVTAPLVGASLLPLSQIPLEMAISIDGAPIFDVDITITLDNGYEYVFRVRGSRLTRKEQTFFSDANWTGGLVMTSRYLTSIFKANETSEVRQCCRVHPVKEMTFEFAVTGRDFVTAAWGLLQGLARVRTYLPLYQDVAYVTQKWTGGKIPCDTRYKRFFPGYKVIIAPRRYDLSYKEPTNNDTAIYYTATISQVVADGIYVTSSPLAEIEAGTAIYPAILSEIAVGDVNGIAVVSGERAIFDVTINEVYGSEVLPVANADYVPTLFYDFAFFDFEWNWLTPPEVFVGRDAVVDDSGRYQTMRTNTPYSTSRFKAVVAAYDRESWWALAGFLGFIKGRHKAFWVKHPLHSIRKGIYTLYAGSNLTELEVYFYGGESNLYSAQALWLQSSDGTEVITKITGHRASGVGGFILEVDPVEISDIVNIRQVFLVRSDSDEIQENWITASGLVEVGLNMIELPAGYTEQGT
jgi:hypothetical protein